MKLERTFRFSPVLFGIMPVMNVLFLVLVFYVMGSKFILNPGVQVMLLTGLAKTCDEAVSALAIPVLVESLLTFED